MKMTTVRRGGGMRVRLLKIENKLSFFAFILKPNHCEGVRETLWVFYNIKEEKVKVIKS